jgi:sugar lactone lactonase YvrE
MQKLALHRTGTCPVVFGMLKRLLLLTATATLSAQDLGGDLTLHRLLIDGEDWKPVAEGLAFADGPTTDAEGNFYFSDMRGDAAGVYRITPGGEKTKLSPEGVSGLKFAPDGRLIACQGAKKRVIAIDLKNGGAVEELATDVQPNDLVVSAKGYAYFTETGKKQVTLLDLAKKEIRTADTGITAPNGITLSPDQSTLAVSDYRGANVWTFRVEADGTLSAKMPTMTMRRPVDPKGEFKFNEPPPLLPASGGDGMISDESGRFFVATTLGVQVFDPTSRECGLLRKPQPDKPLTSCTLSGEGRSFLYVTNGDRIFRRKVQAVGSFFASGKK